MRFLLDEMLSGIISNQLRARGIDAEAVVDRPGLPGAGDEDVLAIAAAERRTLVTLNIGDFTLLDRRWRAEGRTHSGIVLVSTRSFPLDAAFVGSVTNALSEMRAEPQGIAWFL